MAEEQLKWDGYANAIEKLKQSFDGVDSAVADLRCVGGSLAIAADKLEELDFQGQAAGWAAGLIVQAVDDGDNDLIRMLKTMPCCNLDARSARTDNKGEQTPLTRACELGHHDSVVTLLELGADPMTTIKCSTDILTLCQDEPSTIGDLTPLYIAAEAGRVDSVSALAKAGANVDGLSKYSRNEGESDSEVCAETALYIAASRGHVETVNTLIEAGADLDLASRAGETALYTAAQHGRNEVASALIAAGASIDLATTDEVTQSPLFVASMEGDLEMVELLLATGADPNTARQNDGQTAVFVAADLGFASVVQCLIAHGADADRAREDNGETPVYAAAFHGDIEVVRVLCTAGADLNKAKTHSGLTPLMATTFGNRRSLVVAQTLVCHGADMNAVNCHGVTAGALAAQIRTRNISTWLDSVAGYSAYQCSASLRLHSTMRWLLRTGRCDPCEAVAGTRPALQLAPCGNLRAQGSVMIATRLAKDAQLPWCPERHLLHPPATRSCVFLMLLTAKRLQLRGASGGRSLPRLPLIVWLAILSFIHRGFWKAYGRESLCVFPDISGECLGQRSSSALALVD